MKKSIFLYLLLAFCSHMAHAQITFQKTYGLANSWSEGTSAQHTSDGGYVVAGRFTSLSDYKSKVYLVKTDVNGALQWSRTYGDTTVQWAQAVRQTTDRGFIITGSILDTAGHADVYLLKTDSNGVLQWSTAFGGVNDDYGNSVLQTADGGYAIAGTTNSFGAGSDDVYLIKTDANGTLQWTRTFGGTQSDISSSILQTPNGGFLICGGSTSFGTAGQEVYLIKTDATGNYQWANTYGGPLNDGGISAAKTYDGGYALIGGSNGTGSTNIYLLKTDSSGALQWTKTYDAGQFETGYSVEQTNDHGFILAGTSMNFGSTPARGYVIKTDSTGSIQWSKVYGGANGASLPIASQASDGGYIFAGATDHLLLIKTDANASMGCNDSIPTFITSSVGSQGTGCVQGSGGQTYSVQTQSGNGGVGNDLCGTGISETSKQQRGTVFPNPFSSQAILQMDRPMQSATISLENCFGECIQQIRNVTGQSVAIPRDNLPAGVYFIRVTEGGKVIWVNKVIVAGN